MTVRVVLEAGHQAGESLGFNRLDQVSVEAGLQGALAIFRPPVAGDGDETPSRGARHCAEPARELVAIHVREPDVDEHDVWLEAADRLGRCMAVCDGLHLMSVDFEHRAE